MKKIKLYDIHGKSALDNYKTLITDDNKYFYWDYNRFKKYDIGDIVFWVNRFDKVALYTVVDNKSIKPKWSNGKNIISDLRYQISANAITPDRYEYFYRFKILDKKQILSDWKYTNITPFNSQGMELILFEEKIKDLPKRIEKLEDLLRLFNDHSEIQKIINNAINILKGNIKNKKLALPIDTYQEDPLSKNNISKGDIMFDKSDYHKISIIYHKEVTELGFRFERNLIDRFIASLTSKPFVILTGLSGSGKTKLAQAFVTWICDYDFNKHQEIINTTVTYTEKSINNSFGWTLKRQIVEQLIGEDDKYVKAKIADIELEKCKLEYKNIFYYKTDEQKNNVSKKIKEEYSIGDEIPVTIFLDRENDNHVSEQYKLIPVGADWTNREPLLGYPNALEIGKYVKPENGVLDLILNAEKNSDKPYFLILDEMNLSHVERYFADFLSAMESEEEIPLHQYMEEWKDDIPDKVKLPENLFVIGTVNIDETTYMFSPKVLDRANVIEFKVTDDELVKFLENPSKPDLKLIKGKGAGMAADFVNLAKSNAPEFEGSDILNTTLLEFFNELKKTGAEFGYRTVSEIHSFCSKLNLLTNDEEITFEIDDMIDAAILQKLLPKLHGSRKKLEPILNSLAMLCLVDEEKQRLLNANQDIGKLVDETVKNETNIRFKLSMEKILRMKRRVIQDGFTSFAEA